MYDVVQTVYKLSGFSGGVGDVTGQTAEDLQRRLRGKLLVDLATPDVAAELVWGPCIFQSAETGVIEGVADNAMYVARIPRFDTYVVAIAGTNPNSTYDIEKLDLNVRETASFPTGVRPQGSTSPSNTDVGRISAGTALGITNLLEMSELSNLQTFLNRTARPDATLVFTGHSLGGALAPALALWLYPRPATGSGWRAVRVLPTAAPSPGDQAFSNAFAQAFPITPLPDVPAAYAFWNAMIWNQSDVVPHTWTDLWTKEHDPTKILWDVEMSGFVVTAATSLYGPLSPQAIAERPFEHNIGYSILNLSLLPGMTYARLPNRPRSSPNPYLPDPLVIDSFDDFQRFAYANHIPWYNSFFGVPFAKEELPKIGISLLSPSAAKFGRGVRLGAEVRPVKASA